MTPRSLRHRAPALWLLLPFMTGIVGGKILEGFLSPGIYISTAIVSAIAAVTVRRRFLWWAIAFSCATFFSGAAYFQLRDFRPTAWAELPPREIHATVSLERVFVGTSKASQLSGIARIEAVDSGASEILHQSVYVSLKNFRDLTAIRTAQLKVHGLISPIPREAPNNSFEEYLLNAGVNFKLDRGNVLKVARQPAAYARFCEALRRRLSAILGQGLDRQPKLAGAGRALFLGEVSELGADRRQLYIESSTLHFFAIDGLHIAVVALALHILFGLTRCPRFAAFVGVAITLWLYADATGRSPSAVRAVLTVLFFEAAFLLKRPINPLASLSASALISLAISPHELFGASFQMSYGIVAALLLLGLPLAERWQDRWALLRFLPKVSWSFWHHGLSKFHRALVGGVAVGLATALFADLCGVLFFQVYAPNALLANLLLIPAASLALAASFCSVVCGLIGISWGASVFNHATALILSGMDRCIRFLVTLPFAVIHLTFRSTTLGFAAVALLMTSLLYGYAIQWRWLRGGWLPPFAITALALLFATK